MLEKAFHKDANLLLAHDKKPFWQVPFAEYLSWFNKPNLIGKYSGRDGHILSINIRDSVANATVRINMPDKNRSYIDHIQLKKFDKRWLIISKAAQKQTVRQQKRILFIVSSANTHGETQLPAGASFSELVYAYDAFDQAGFDIDFISTSGGEVPLAYIDPSNPDHTKYLFDTDFMYALKIVKQPRKLMLKTTPPCTILVAVTLCIKYLTTQK